MKYLHACKDAPSQRLIYQYPVYGLESISGLKSQCENMTFSDQSIYNSLFWKVVHKGRESEIKYIKIFQNDKYLEILIGNFYSEDQLVHTFLDKFQ